MDLTRIERIKMIKNDFALTPEFMLKSFESIHRY